MYYHLNLDADGYLMSVSMAGEPEQEEIESLIGLDLSGNRIGAYKWDGEKLVFDAVRYAAIEKEQAAAAIREQIAELTERLRATDGEVIEALEVLFSATTATGFISALVSEAKTIGSTLSERASLRKTIAELSIKD